MIARIIFVLLYPELYVKLRETQVCEETSRLESAEITDVGKQTVNIDVQKVTKSQFPDRYLLLNRYFLRRD